MGAEQPKVKVRCPVGMRDTKMQAARSAVRQARAVQLARAAEREARIEKLAIAVVLAWEAREKATERLSKAEEHVIAQLRGLVVEKLSVGQIVTLTGIPQRHCRTLMRDPPNNVPAADDRRDVELEGQRADGKVGGA